MQRRKFLLASALSIPVFAAARKMNSGRAGKIKGFVVKQGQSRFDERTKIGDINPVDIKVSAKDTEGVLSISEYTGYTKGGPPVHIHPNQDEVFIVLEGEHLFQLDQELHRLTPGDTIFIPRGTPHAPAQLSEKGKYLFFFTPSGSMEDFFRALGEIKFKGQPPADLMLKIFQSHDMKVVGPPLKIEQL